MRFGVCAPIEAADIAADAGCDYIEPQAAATLVPDREEAEWLPIARQIAGLRLVPETFNVFLRGFKVVGPEADLEAAERYVNCALTRAAQVGGQVIVFGSAGARNVPDGFSRDTARRQLLSFLAVCADAAEATGVTVAIEPLCRRESNIINALEEAASLCAETRRSGVRLLADSYHMEAESEPLPEITRFARDIAHVHTADTGRLAPGTGSYPHRELFATLRRAGYDERVSIECTWEDRFAELVGPAISALRAAHAEASAEL